MRSDTRVGLPVDQDTGNLEGKEMRFGPAAGPTWAACTTCTSNGSVNCMHDSLNPLAGLTPLTGMWLNCMFGGVGVGLINLLVYMIIAVFLAGLMVGRTPEYLGKKVEAREMKLAVAGPAGPAVPRSAFRPACSPRWNGGRRRPTIPARTVSARSFTSSPPSFANNGSGFEGLATPTGLTMPTKSFGHRRHSPSIGTSLAGW